MYHKTEREIMNNWKRDGDLPMVSICCTTYNHESYIAEAIEGFLMQETNFPFEILIRDDCSIDKTADIVKKYAEKYPSLIQPVFEKVNTYSKGVRPMPQLYKIAKGKYIALCEGDDYWTDPRKLQKQVDFLETHEEYSLCYTAATLKDDSGKIINPDKRFGDSTEKELISGWGTAITGSMVFRHIAELDSLNKENIVNGDNILWHLLGFHGKCKLIDDLANTVYRIHDNGIWSGRSEKNKLLSQIQTYSVIRKNIITHFGEKSDILKKHDFIYETLFVNYWGKALQDLNFKNYLFGILTLWKLKHLPRIRIFLVHIKEILSLKFLKLDKK